MRADLELLHATARLSVEWMAYCLIEGTFLSLFVWLLLRLFPRQNAGTRFFLWFSALLAMVALPSLHGAWPRFTGSALTQAVSNGRGLITLSDSMALYIFFAWATVAGLVLIRVLLGLWQVRKLRSNSCELDRNSLAPAVRQAMEEFPGALSLRVSDNVRVPTAIGFSASTVIVPTWFLEEMSSEELRQILLHEMAHLRRHDDWTNLLQKIIRAGLFFHPCAWWIEQQLSLEREIACDDAVLAQTATPHDYAQCLRRVAEKSFLRRKLALAQAIVTRIGQLSRRMAMILDTDRPGTTRLWKPAVPVVVAIACVCGFSAATAPAVVSFSNNSPAVSVTRSAVNHSVALPGEAQAVKADLRSSSVRPGMVLTAALSQKAPPTKTSVAKTPAHQRAVRSMQAKADPEGDYVVQSEQVIVTMTSDRLDKAGQPVWQVHMWQVRVLVPANNHFNRNTSRKNI